MRLKIGTHRHATVHNNAAFRQVAASGCKWVTPGFIVQLLPAVNASSFAVGFTASRKVGGAVQRNRAKRLMRVLLQHGAASLTDSPFAAIVLIARPAILELPFPVLQRDMAWALRKLLPLAVNQHSSRE